MIKKYLIEDQTGVYSGIEYAKKGDMITVIDDTGPMVLVENKGERFHVWPNKLSDLPVTEVVEGKSEVVEVKSDIVQAWLPVKEEQAAEPTDLFGGLIQKKKSKKK